MQLLAAEPLEVSSVVALNSELSATCFHICSAFSQNMHPKRQFSERAGKCVICLEVLLAHCSDQAAEQSHKPQCLQHDLKSRPTARSLVISNNF